MGSLRSGYFTEAVREAAIARAYLHPEMVVADVGAGTGFMSAGLAPLVQQVHVVDGSPAMLDVARKNLAAFDNLEFHQADGLSLPLPDASLDAVFANMYLHHCPDPLAAIQEMVRTLRPGGRLVITDMDAHDHAWLKEEMADVWLGFDRDQIRAWFEQAGLVNVIVDCTGRDLPGRMPEPRPEHRRASASLSPPARSACAPARPSRRATPPGRWAPNAAAATPPAARRVPSRWTTSPPAVCTSTAATRPTRRPPSRPRRPRSPWAAATRPPWPTCARARWCSISASAAGSMPSWPPSASARRAASSAST